MSTFEIKMPKLGESITEGTIMVWLVKVGDVINEDDVLFEVNTAKVSAEIPSPVAGRVLEVLFKEGDTVAVGTVVAIVALEGEAEESVSADGAETVQPAGLGSGASVALTEDVAATPAKELPRAQAVKQEGERWLSPVVLQLARTANLSTEELQALPGTGYQGRLSKKDLQQYIARRQRSENDTPKTPCWPTRSLQPLDLPHVEEREASGHQVHPHVGQHEASGHQVHLHADEHGAADTQSSPHADEHGDIEVKEMDRVRKMIADHMVMSKHTSPHVTTLVEVDMTRIVKWREAHKEAFQKREGVKLTYMPAITEATARALAAYPQVNVSVEGYNILYKKRINVGIAVSQDNGNLIVPVVHDANRLNLSGLAIAIHSLASKARIGKLMPDDIAGGTFTITNFGTFGSLFGTPIINQPQVAILGVGVIEKKPAVIETPEGDVIAIRHKMYLSLSYDHRVVDGSLGGKFLYFIKEYLEGWEL